MKKFSLIAASLLASSVLAAPASAAVTFTFEGGLATPSAGYIIVDTFDNTTGLTGSGFQIKTPPADGNGAPPANSVPAGTPYLSVLGGGSATFTFAQPVAGFQFDWGSIDTYNTLTITGSGATIIIPGTNFTNPANGNQVSPGTNGRFTVFGTAGETFTSVTFSSSQNSFEVDNLAVRPVPEPATWAMMLVGFGLVGYGLRSRRRQSVRVTYA